MASLPGCDPIGDHLLTPQSATLELVRVDGEDPEAFDMPIVHSTINAATGGGRPTGRNSPSCYRTTGWRPAGHVGCLGR
jgi:hypothetical protein